MLIIQVPIKRLTLLVLVLLVACSDHQSWNNPYPVTDSDKNIIYNSFAERPKHLDPAQSYTSAEVVFTGQIYEPPLQYHYLKRPFELIPLTTTTVPKPKYFDKNDKRLPDNAAVKKIAYTIIGIEIQPGIQYQPHPALARNEKGEFLYLSLSDMEIQKRFKLSDFEQTGSRELIAEDYVYQIKRLAKPDIHSPILSLMSEYISGLGDYAKRLARVKVDRENSGGDPFIDLRDFDFDGVKITGRYTYQVKINGKYPQFLYWLAMPFFAPMPYEADIFYSQKGMDKRNISLDWFPIGTGPYMLTENNPNLRMVMERNPNFHGESYPSEGEPGDEEQGLLVDAGKPLPFVDKVIYSLEKENIPSWNKFLQGYYDVSGISSDSFDQAVNIGSSGEAELTDEMKERNIRLQIGVATSIYYVGFNMQDDVIGGLSARAQKIRQAVAIAIDYEENISIFRNGRGTVAHSPIPPGIFGHKDGEAGINPYVYDWVDGRPKRKSIDYAKQLLREAGYPNGRDAKSGKPLTLYYDNVGTGPDVKSLMDWYRQQFKKIDIQLDIRSTDYNRFQDKMLKGNAQIFSWGWNADYPDPENFLFLLYGPNKKIGKNGENAANYENKKFDRYFEKMKNMDNSPERQAIIDNMIEILRKDSPWIFGFYPVSYGLYHEWYQNSKPNLMANNTLKYKKVDPELRAKKRAEWNKPIVWPIWTGILILVVVFIPGLVVHSRRKRSLGVSS